MGMLLVLCWDRMPLVTSIVALIMVVGIWVSLCKRLFGGSFMELICPLLVWTSPPKLFYILEFLECQGMLEEYSLSNHGLKEKIAYYPFVHERLKIRLLGRKMVHQEWREPTLIYSYFVTIVTFGKYWNPIFKFWLSQTSPTQSLRSGGLRSLTSQLLRV